MSKPTKTNGKRKRATRGQGRLYKRVAGGKDHPPDSPIKAPYWLAYSLPSDKGDKSKRVRQPLRDADGKPITDRKGAEAERKRIMAPFHTGERIEALHESDFREYLQSILEARNRERGIDEKLTALEEREINEAVSGFIEILGRTD
jgi:hypothetical protein